MRTYPALQSITFSEYKMKRYSEELFRSAARGKARTKPVIGKGTARRSHEGRSLVGDGKESTMSDYNASSD